MGDAVGVGVGSGLGLGVGLGWGVRVGAGVWAETTSAWAAGSAVGAAVRGTRVGAAVSVATIVSGCMASAVCFGWQAPVKRTSSTNRAAQQRFTSTVFVILWKSRGYCTMTDPAPQGRICQIPAKLV